MHLLMNGTTDKRAARCQIATWATLEKKRQFGAVAASQGLSESKMLAVLVESVLARNPTNATSSEDAQRSRSGDRVTIRLRPGDGLLLRRRAEARGMNYTT